MAVNYLQYIGSVQQGGVTFPNVRFLVSGVDSKVRQIVGQNIVSSAYDRGKTLFVVDNTQSYNAMRTDFGRYQVVNVLNGEVSLCNDLLNVNSLKSISRLRSLLSDLGFDGTRAMKIVTYLNFVKETQRRLGNSTALTIDILEQYGSMMLVEWKLKQLVETGSLSEENYRYLMGRYSEVSGAAADFETFLVLLSPFMGDTQPTPNMAVHLSVGEFTSDKPMQEILSKLLISYIKQNIYNSYNSAILILDDGNGEDRRFIIDILKNIPVNAEIHMLSNDAFTFGEADRSILMNTFPVRIYTRHDNMTSCGKIESLCGQIDVVKHSSSITVDKRFKANSAWDMLLGINRTETSIANAPTKEYRFRKEIINTMHDGTGIIDCAGNKVMFSF